MESRTRTSAVLLDAAAPGPAAPQAARNRRKSDWGAIAALESLGRARLGKEFIDEMEEMEGLLAVLLKDEKTRHSCDLCGQWLGSTIQTVGSPVPAQNNNLPSARWYRCLSCDTIPVYCAVCIRKTHLPFDNEMLTTSVDPRWIAHDIEPLFVLDAVETSQLRRERSRAILTLAATEEEADELCILLAALAEHEEEERRAIQVRAVRAPEWALALHGMAFGAAQIIQAEEQRARKWMSDNVLVPFAVEQTARAVVTWASVQAELWRMDSFLESESRHALRVEEEALRNELNNDFYRTCNSESLKRSDSAHQVPTSVWSRRVVDWALTVSIEKTTLLSLHSEFKDTCEAQYLNMTRRASAELYAGLFSCRVSVYFAQLSVMQTRGLEERHRMEIRAREHLEAITIKRLMSQGKWQAIEQSQRRSHEESAARGLAFLVVQQEEVLRVRLSQRRTKSIHALVQDFWARTRLDHTTLIASVGPVFAAAIDQLLVVVANGLPLDSEGAPLLEGIETSKWHLALKALGLPATSTLDAIANPPVDGEPLVTNTTPQLHSVTPANRFGRSVRGLPSMTRIATSTEGGGPTASVGAPYLPAPTIKALASRSLVRIPWPSPADHHAAGLRDAEARACLSVVVSMPLQTKVSTFVTSLRAGNIRLPKQPMPPRTPMSSKAVSRKLSNTSTASAGATRRESSLTAVPMTPKQVKLSSPNFTGAEATMLDNMSKIDISTIFIESSGVAGSDDEVETPSLTPQPLDAEPSDFLPSSAMSLVASCLVVPCHYAPHLTATHVVEDAVTFAEACRLGQDLIARENQNHVVDDIVLNHRKSVYAKVQAAKDAYIATTEREELLKKQRAASRSKSATSQAWKQHTPSPALTSATSGSEERTPQTNSIMPASRAASVSPQRRSAAARTTSPKQLAKGITLEVPAPISRQASPSPSSEVGAATPRAMVELAQDDAKGAQPQDFAAIVALLRRPISPAQRPAVVRPSSALSQRRSSGASESRLRQSRTPDVTQGPKLPDVQGIEARQRVAIRYEVLARQPGAVAVLHDAVQAQQRVKAHQVMSRAEQLHLKSVAHAQKRSLGHNLTRPAPIK